MKIYRNKHIPFVKCSCGSSNWNISTDFNKDIYLRCSNCLKFYPVENELLEEKIIDEISRIQNNSIYDNQDSLIQNIENVIEHIENEVDMYINPKINSSIKALINENTVAFYLQTIASELRYIIEKERRNINEHIF